MTPANRGTLRVGTAFGIPVLVHASWVIAFGLAVVSLGHELSGAPGVRWLLAVLTALAFFASVVGHELAHALVALRFGVPVRSITLFVFGGLATLGGEPKRPRDELFVAAAGPLASLVIGVASWALARVVPDVVAEPIAWLGRVNVGLAIFNCLPGFPLDGGRMLRAILWSRSGDESSATLLAAKVGRALAYGFIGLGFWTATAVSMASGLWMGFIGWFLLQAAQASLSDVALRSAIDGLSAANVMARDFPSVPGALDVGTYVEGIVFPSGDRAHLVRDEDGITGVVTLEQVLAVPRARWRATPIAQVATPITEVPRVDVYTPVAEVLHAMGEEPLALVMAPDGLVGVVERQHLYGLVETRLDVSRVTPLRRAAAMVALAALLFASGCDMRAPDREPPPTPAPAATIAAPAPTVPLQCGSLRDVDESDVVRVDGDRVYYADEGAGLVALDLADPDRPRTAGASPFVGTPLAVHLSRGPTAGPASAVWLVFVDWDGRALPQRGVATVVRAVVPDDLRPLGEIVVPGIARGVTLVGDALYVLREREGGRASVTSFRLRGGVVGMVDDVPIEGAPVALAASPIGLAAVGRSDAAVVTWIDLPLESPGAMRVHATVRVPGALAEGRPVAADEDRRVRLVACGADACKLHVLGFGGPGGEETSSLDVGKPGGVARFTDDALYVADATSAGDVATTDLRVVRTDDPRRPRLVARVPLRGAVRALAVAPDAGRVVALGTVGSSATAVRVAVHDLDVREPTAPRLRGTVTFGADFTWSVAEDTDRAVSFDPAASLLAIPFTAFTAAERRYDTGVELVAVGEGRPRLAGAHATDGIALRAVFHRGRLVTIGPEGVRAVPYLDAENRGRPENR